MDEDVSSDRPRYPAIRAQRRTGDERFINAGSEVHTLRDFWAWAYSELLGNTERGKLAEYIVAMALGVTAGISESWGSYDLRSREGIRVEVKTSGYLQSWEQRRLSSIHFGIEPTYAWDSVTNVYEKVRKRQADVYVFAVLGHKEQETLNPLDVGQWEFYALATAVLDKAAPTQKRISLNRLLSVGARPCTFAGLYAVIRQEAGVGA